MDFLFFFFFFFLSDDDDECDDDELLLELLDEEEEELLLLELERFLAFFCFLYFRSSLSATCIKLLLFAVSPVAFKFYFSGDSSMAGHCLGISIALKLSRYAIINRFLLAKYRCT